MNIGAQKNGKKVMTMDEYIEKNEAQKRIASIAILAKSDAQKALMGRVLYCIDHIPVADVAPVRRGRWIIGEIDIFGAPIHCSECGWGSNNADPNKWMKYQGHRCCGFCGAKMEGVE